ncbi:MAG: hypothetical protein WC728_09260 [Elusimicrobiota bacterium]
MRAILAVVIALAAVIPAVVSAADAPAVQVTVTKPDLDFGDLLKNLNVEAQADFGKFVGKLSAQFGHPAEKVEAVIKSVDNPGDAYMALKIAETTKKPVDDVVKEYSANKGKGWGAIAKNLGIKPGSKEFKALKAEGKGKGEEKAKGGKDKAKGGKDKAKGGKGKGKK